MDALRQPQTQPTAITTYMPLQSLHNSLIQPNQSRLYLRTFTTLLLHFEILTQWVRSGVEIYNIYQFSKSGFRLLIDKLK